MTPLKSPAEISSEYEAQIEAVKTETYKQVYFPECVSAPSPRAGCGMLADKWLTENYVVDFMRNVCHEDALAPASEHCRDVFRTAFYDAVKARYRSAPGSRVDAICDSEPKLCMSFEGVELAALRAHNQTVLAEGKARIAELIAAHDREQTIANRARAARARQNADNERAAAIFRAIGDGMAAASRGASQSHAQTNSYEAPSATVIPSPSTALVDSNGSGCSSDFQCGGPGYVCVKPAGSMIGQCAKAVNQFGTQDFMHSPRLDSVGPGKAHCQTMGDCPIGFNCDRGMCIKR